EEDQHGHGRPFLASRRQQALAGLEAIDDRRSQRASAQAALEVREQILVGRAPGQGGRAGAGRPGGEPPRLGPGNQVGALPLGQQRPQVQDRLPYWFHGYTPHADRARSRASRKLGRRGGLVASRVLVVARVGGRSVVRKKRRSRSRGKSRATGLSAAMT